jgi:hypothetical protein
MATEHITMTPYPGPRCVCGNDRWHLGYSPCTADGEYTDAEYFDFLLCEACGRIIDGEGVVVGTRSPTPELIG